MGQGRGGTGFWRQATQQLPLRMHRDPAERTLNTDLGLTEARPSVQCWRNRLQKSKNTAKMTGKAFHKKQCDQHGVRETGALTTPVPGK